MYVCMYVRIYTYTYSEPEKQGEALSAANHYLNTSTGAQLVRAAHRDTAAAVPAQEPSLREGALQQSSYNMYI